MNLLSALATAAALLAEAQTQTVERQTHDHTIYTVQGSADQLAKFQEEIGSQWEGGVLLDRDPEDGIYRYWAFSERTAPQARTFMFGSMTFGLELDIEAYDERRFFPEGRSRLDEIATSCRLAHDPFFITPTGELQLSFRADEPAEVVECAKRKLNDSPIVSGLKVKSTVKEPTAGH